MQLNNSWGNYRVFLFMESNLRRLGGFSDETVCVSPKISWIDFLMFLLQFLVNWFNYVSNIKVWIISRHQA